MSEWNAFSSEPPPGIPWGINFGGGVNSTALILLCGDMHLRPDWIVFSDTGSERPETYQNVEEVEKWCRKEGFPFAVTRWIRKDGTFESVHDNCLRSGYLPSKAYGYSGCTYKWKIQPLQKWRKLHGFTPSGVAIGYDAGEKRRLQNARKRMCQDTEVDSDETVWYPLAAWGVDRQACIERILRQGWTPSKSACFCCPSAKPQEWEELERDYPELMQISRDIQVGAQAAGHATTAKLFRSYDPKTANCVCTADGCLVSEAQE